MQHIHYAKSKSYATHRVEDPNFVPPSTANASSLSTKRQRDGDVVGDRPKKREKADESDEEMEIDEDDEKQDTSTSHRSLIRYLDMCFIIYNPISCCSNKRPISGSSSHNQTFMSKSTPRSNGRCTGCFIPTVSTRHLDSFLYLDCI